MKNALIIICSLVTITASAQSILGAWESSSTINGQQLKTVLLFSDKYQVATTFDSITGEFIKTTGGSYSINGNTMNQSIEFDSELPKNVGTQTTAKIDISEKLLIFAENSVTFKRIDKNEPGKLHGAWLMSGRVTNGERQLRDTSGPRKTMKILSGTRFQWIAYNVETQQFMGTGGGTYTTVNGDYNENIEFFSKDNSKVGLSLKFNYELNDGDWNHTGFSSKGDPINEIWSVRKK